MKLKRRNKKSEPLAFQIPVFPGISRKNPLNLKMILDCFNFIRYLKFVCFNLKGIIMQILIGL